MSSKHSFPLLVMVNNVCGKDICKQVTTFDALCVNNGILYILSANPCLSKNSISLTIISMKNASSYSRIVIDHDTEDPIPICKYFYTFIYFRL